MRIEELTTYEILEDRQINDLNSRACLLRHKKTGARVALLSNDDENKVFYIGFRTPPKDSTGVAHILEHSVLCGSEKYPVKDPFVELVKGSLNTFLNALTYSDKTLYPVASCNDKDFDNLMSVYLDAVFHPNIYKYENIFRQEGWHYEMEKPEDELKINGVVYNEMKGAFSSPDDVLEREILNSLYPDTTYGNESGGDPSVIPQLTYEDFLAFHGKFYHPSNSYIYLYGNLDMAEKLAYIDEAYLSHYDAITVDSIIETQEGFTEAKRVVREYPISQGDKEEENGILSLNFSIGDSLDQDLYVTLKILDYALCTTPGAPLKTALVDKGIGQAVKSTYDIGVKQPFFSIIAKDTSIAKEKEFLDTIEEVLQKQVKEGINRNSLLSAINFFEFQYREADFKGDPAGLMYGLQMLDSWLYDDTKPFIHIEANATFARLKKKVEEGYFEQFIDKYFLKNKHRSIVLLAPKVGLQEEREEAERIRLGKLKESMTKAEIEKIIADYQGLQAYQEAEEAPEDLQKIPMLTRADLKAEASKLVFEERSLGDTKLIYHDVFTNGIGYLRLIFDLKNIPEEYFPYVGLFTGCLGLLSTTNYKYGDLFNELYLVSGGMSAVNNVYSHVSEIDRYKVTLEIKIKVLYPNLNKAMKLLEEIILESDFTDTKRLYEILGETKSGAQSGMMSKAHTVALGRALSYGSAAQVVDEYLSGYDNYQLVAGILDNYEEEKENLVEKLSTLAKMVFRKENLIVDYISESKALAGLEEPINALREKLYTVPVKQETFVPVPTKKNEGLMTSASVQYVCRAGNFRRKGLAYTGALRVLKVLMGYEYLWTNVREKGGAYGCLCAFGRTGDSYFVSYRDPNLGNTIEIYEKAADAVASYEADERTMTQYIIGAVSSMDIPLTPSIKGLRGLSAYFTGLTQEMVQKDRDEVLQATPESIRALAAHIRAFMEDDFLCVVGNASKIKEEKDKFLVIENLL